MGLLDKFKKPFEKLGKGKGEKSLQVKADKVDKKEKKETSPKPLLGKEGRSEVQIKDPSGHASQVIVRPMQTEKHTDLMQKNQYVFEVAVDTNKSEVKKAIENMYKVKPKGVNIINMRGKMVRFGRTWAKRKNWKKAIITLRPDDKIEVFTNV